MNKKIIGVKSTLRRAQNLVKRQVEKYKYKMKPVKRTHGWQETTVEMWTSIHYHHIRIEEFEIDKKYPRLEV